MIRNEYGSDFHYPINYTWLLEDAKNSPFNTSSFSLFFSGRAALYFLLKQGIVENKWKTLYLPSYYCHEVPPFIEGLSIKVKFYSIDPFGGNLIDTSKMIAAENPVLVRVSYFGKRIPSVTEKGSLTIIDDTTHNLDLIESSDAHYCFGSLRKELPVPAGGFCYSSKSLKLPQASVLERSNEITSLKLHAMQEKFDYLKGVVDDKEMYLKKFKQGEELFDEAETRSGLPNSGIDVLYRLNVPKILTQKRSNLALSLKELRETQIDNLNEALKQADEYSYGLVFNFKHKETKTNFKSFLIQQDIYPATLWPNQSSNNDKDIEERMLFLHIDFRYNASQISILTQRIIPFFAK